MAASILASLGTRNILPTSTLSSFGLPANYWSQWRFWREWEFLLSRDCRIRALKKQLAAILNDFHLVPNKCRSVLQFLCYQCRKGHWSSFSRWISAICVVWRLHPLLLSEFATPLGKHWEEIQQGEPGGLSEYLCPLSTNSTVGWYGLGYWPMTFTIQGLIQEDTYVCA